jgi:hypothetical protein
MSENHNLLQPSSAQAVSQSRGKLTLLNSLIILVIIYLLSGAIQLLVTLKVPSIITWLELGQWALVVIWLLVGVRPPFMEWLKRVRERNE